jgi:DNA-binding transcriptional LysR family regulator
MEIQALRYVVTLAEELHFGRAANRHFISAQPFGQRVRRLEQEVGARLFERTSRRVSLTPTGERFVARARVVLAELDGLREIAAEEGRADGVSLRVGVLGFGVGDHWQALRDVVEAQQPGLALEFRDLDLVDQYDCLRRGEVDVAVVQFVGDLDGVDFEPVLTSPRVAVIPVSSKLAEAPFLTLADLNGLSWLDAGPLEPSLRSWVGSERDTRAPYVPYPAAIPAAVATTGRAALHAAEAARFYPRSDVRFVPLEGPPVEVAVATRSGDGRAAVSAFRRAAAAIRCQSSG